jgi:hypothetical protein
LTISRLERDILRLKKQLNAEGPSHEAAAPATFSTGPCYQETPKSQENPTANPEIPAPPPVEPVQQPDTALHTYPKGPRSRHKNDHEAPADTRSVSKNS